MPPTGGRGHPRRPGRRPPIMRGAGSRFWFGDNTEPRPPAMAATSRAGQWNVLELSSFQLETIENFHAHIGAALNVTPDHLDRHHTFEKYAASKTRLFETQRDGDFASLNTDDPTCVAQAGR